MIKIVLKFLFAGGLVYWLFQNGRIDFKILLNSLNRPAPWIFTILLLCTNMLIVTFRWKAILEIKSSKKFSYLSILRLTWIGNLFNTALPGVVSGDVIKLVYARNIDRNLSKTFLLTSVVVDRMLGLFGLLTLMGVSTIIQYGTLISLGPNVQKLVYFNGLIILGMFFVLTTLFLKEKFQKIILKICGKIPLLGSFISNAFIQLWIIGKYKKVIFSLIGLSAFSQNLGITAFWILTNPYFQYLPEAAPLTITKAYSFIPLGLVSIAIPITPSGIGVGHTVFHSLFNYFGVNNGATLFNFFFFAALIVNLFGIFPYLMSNKKEINFQKAKELVDQDNSGTESA